MNDWHSSTVSEREGATHPCDEERGESADESQSQSNCEVRLIDSVIRLVSSVLVALHTATPESAWPEERLGGQHTTVAR